MNLTVTDHYIELTVACDDCGATGLYQGFAQLRGTAVICATCLGTGGRVLRFNPYTGRKPREGIKRIEAANTIWFPETSDTITYEEFVSGVPETPQRKPEHDPVPT